MASLGSASPAGPPPLVDGLTSITPEGDTLRVREVWASNLEAEMAIIQSIVEDYRLISMDTEFPGVVARPVGQFRTAGDFYYGTIRANVDLLKLIQLGLTFTDEAGRLPRHDGELCVWQFNFREFRLGEDMYAQDSIDLLRVSGIDFARHEAEGVDVLRFGELLMTSGVVLNPDVRWVTFAASYDFGYLLKVLTCSPLPPTEADFFDLLKLYFPSFFDIKYLMKFCGALHGGLSRLAEQLCVERIGPQHQAGSDSLLTASSFIKLVRTYFAEESDLDPHQGILYGLGSDGTADVRDADG